jgi:hypothetical protein
MYRERDKTWRIRASLQDYDNIIFLKKNILKPGAYGQVYRTMIILFFLKKIYSNLAHTGKFTGL